MTEPSLLAIVRIVFLACFLTSIFSILTAGQRPDPKSVVARFGGECEGSEANIKPQLKKLIAARKQRYSHPCTYAGCEKPYSHDLNGDGLQDYFFDSVAVQQVIVTMAFFSNIPQSF